MDTTCLANEQRQTGTINYTISTMWETKPKMTPRKTFNCQCDWNRSQGQKTLQGRK